MDDLQDELISGLKTLDLIDEAYSELKMSLSDTDHQEDVYKKIFELLAKSKNWNALFTEWEDYSTSYAMSQEDWINFAKAALNANYLEKTKMLLEKMKSAGVNRTQIDVISGNLYYKEGEFEKARVLLEETTKRLPDYEEGWIVLSNVYNDMGLIQKSMETLHVAVLAIPDSHVIHFNLAKNCLDQELFAEALPYIRKAVALEPDNSFYNLNLTQTLQTLGRIDEADQILSQSRLKWPYDREIAYVDAVRQIEKQNRDAALAAFDVALKSQDSNIPMQRLILYVQTLLGDRPEKFLPTDGKYNEISNLLNAQKILQIATNSNSEDTYYLQMLLGEVYYLTGEAEAANSLYSKLVNEFKSNQPHQSFLWRVYAGLGLVKIDLSEVESGIAALQEADQLNSNHLGIKQKITETYFSASLLNQAESKAEEIYQLGSTNIDNLLWYANFMAKIGNSDGETRGLEQILHFEPAHSTAIARLANIYISNGELERAKEVLEKLNGADHLDNQAIRNAVISYLRIGNYLEALDWFNKLVDDDDGVDVKKRVVEKIFLLMANQKWEAALSEIQRLKKTTVNSRLVSSLEGECLFKSEDYSAAIYAFDAASSFPADDESSVNEYLFENLLIPDNWFQQKINDFSILYFITKAYKNIFEFGQCLDMIDRMIKINPKEPWLFLMGAEFSMQLTDYDLTSNYLLKYKTCTGTENTGNEIDLFATALDYACAFLDGRDYRFSFREDESKNDLGLVLKAHQHLDKNLFEDALQLFEEIKTNLAKPAVLINEEQDGEIKNSIFRRLYLILVWRLNDFPKAAELLQQFDVENTKNIEKAYLNLAIEFTYMTMLDLFNKNGVQAHRSSIFEQEISDPNKINQLLKIINHQGKTKAIKNLESLAKVYIEKDYSIGFSLINSRTLPKFMNFILVDLLMKAGKSEIINDYISNFKSEFYENMFLLVNERAMSLEEQIAFIEAQVPTDDPAWLIESSRIFEKSGNLQQAIELAEQAYKIWPEEEMWAIRIANLYDEGGDFESADQYWKNIVSNSQDPNSVIYQYVNLLIENKKAIEAIRLLNEYKGKLTESFDLYRAHAKANLLLKSYENSINAIQSARKYKPVSIELDYLEAEAFYLNAEIDKSKNKIQEILNISPAYEPAYILNSVILKEN
jgi:predicted Zn-dependent protease